MVAELLQTLLGGMIIDKGKPKSPKKNPSEFSWDEGTQAAIAYSKKLTQLGLGLLTFYIRVHAGP